LTGITNLHTQADYFHSKHPLSQKRGIITSSTDKILLLSNLEFHQKSFLFLINNLLMNDYPLDRIFCSIKERLSIKFRHLNHGTSLLSYYRYKKYLFCHSIHRSHSWQIHSKTFQKLFKNIPTFKLAFFGINKLNKFIKVYKDPLPLLSRSKIVYKINCLHCDSSYVGHDDY